MTRASRTRHPLQSLFLFVVVCAVAYFAYENRHLMTGKASDHLTAKRKSEIRDMILAEFGTDADFVTVRSISWRPRERRYRLDVELDDATSNARDMCLDIAAFIAKESEMEATVVGVDSTGRELGRAVT